MGAGMMDTVEDIEISYNHPRLKKCFKTLIWFSEIFPKKYQNEFVDDIVELCKKPKNAPREPKKAVDALDAKR